MVLFLNMAPFGRPKGHKSKKILVRTLYVFAAKWQLILALEVISVDRIPTEKKNKILIL